MRITKKQLEDFIVGSMRDNGENGWGSEEERAALEALRNDSLEIEGYERAQWKRFDPNAPKTFPARDTPVLLTVQGRYDVICTFAAWTAVKTCEMLSALFLRVVRAPFFAIKLFRFVERNNRLVVRKVSGEYEVKLINCSLLDLSAVVGAFAKHAQKEDVEAAIKLGFREAGKESD